MRNDTHAFPSGGLGSPGDSSVRIIMPETGDACCQKLTKTIGEVLKGG